MAADFIFASHKYIATYLIGPTSVFGPHVSACCAQWKRDEISEYFDRFQHITRRSQLLVNYVDYPTSKSVPWLVTRSAYHRPGGGPKEAVHGRPVIANRSIPTCTGWRLKMPSGDWLEGKILTGELSLPSEDGT